jgi:hypothetical protein
MKTSALLLCALVSVSAVGCGGSMKETLQNVCDQTNSAIGAAGAYVDEANMTIDRARKVAEALPESIQKEALLAVDAAEGTLYAVTQTAAIISQQCADFDLPTLFRDFAVAWDKVKGYLDKFGGTTSGVVDPTAYHLGKKAR